MCAESSSPLIRTGNGDATLPLAEETNDSVIADGDDDFHSACQDNAVTYTIGAMDATLRPESDQVNETATACDEATTSGDTIPCDYQTMMDDFFLDATVVAEFDDASEHSVGGSQHEAEEAVAASESMSCPMETQINVVPHGTLHDMTRPMCPFKHHTRLDLKPADDPTEPLNTDDDSTDFALDVPRVIYIRRLVRDTVDDPNVPATAVRRTTDRLSRLWRGRTLFARKKSLLDENDTECYRQTLVAL